jgi:hypothetical protein
MREPVTTISVISYSSSSSAACAASEDVTYRIDVVPRNNTQRTARLTDIFIDIDPSCDVYGQAAQRTGFGHPCWADLAI